MAQRYEKSFVRAETILLSKVDVKSIESTFKSLDWDVTTYTDSTVAQIRDIILKEVIYFKSLRLQCSESSWGTST